MMDEKVADVARDSDVAVWFWMVQMVTRGILTGFALSNGTFN